MEVCVLGSGVGVPSLKRAYPGLFVRSETLKMLIDPGPGSVRRLVKFGCDYRGVDTIIITHFHPDHCLDLVSFLFACKYPLAAREKGLLVIGPAGLRNFYDGILKIFGNAITPEIFEVQLREVREDSIFFDKAELVVRPVPHSENSIGLRYRDSDGTVLCYSGDTDYSDRLLELAHGADLLILESSFPDAGKVKGHLTPSYAGRIAREAGAKKLILVHLYPVCDDYDILSECRQEYEGDVQVASDLMKVVL